MKINQQRMTEDRPRDEAILELEVDVESQCGLPLVIGRAGQNRHTDGRVPPGKHAVLVYKSDLPAVEYKTERHPDAVVMAKRTAIALRHDDIKAAVKVNAQGEFDANKLPHGYALPQVETDEWSGVDLPGLNGELADRVRRAAWKSPVSWKRVYRETAAPRKPDGSMSDPGPVRSYKVLRELPPPRSAEQEQMVGIGAEIASAIRSAGVGQRQDQQNQRK